MNGDEDSQSIRHIEDFASIALNGDRAFRQSLRCSRPEGDDEPWMYDLDCSRQPSPACLDLARVGALMQPSLALGSNLKCLTALVT
jgi:hypothetical protein